VSLKILEDKIEPVPNDGNTNVTTTLSSPRIKLREGQEAMISVGRPSHAQGGARTATNPGEMDSGIKVEVISIKGEDRVLLVTSVLEDGSTVWADATMVKVQSEPAGGQTKP
jgi:hypothetical protein